MRGTVLFFNNTYGFIRVEGHEQDIFFHYKAIKSIDERKEVQAGDYVEIEMDEKTPNRAKSVKIIEEIVKGKKLIKVHVYKINNGEFELRDFYEKVISKIPLGLRHVTLMGEFMIATSEKLELDIIVEITKLHHKKGLYVDVLDNYTIKFI